MNRAFLSLYVVIVLSVVLLGWGADKLWQAYNPEPHVTPFEHRFFDLLETLPLWSQGESFETVNYHLSSVLSEGFELYDLEEFAQSSLLKPLSIGEIVSVYDEEGRLLSYKRIASTNYVVCIMEPPEPSQSRVLYIGLLVAFYLAIAVVVYFWVWPLSRDLKKLQKFTQRVGKDGSENISLNQSSTVYDLASAFNAMSDRIKALLASHKEMTYAVSHELRTPLARMKFAMEIMRDEVKTTPSIKHLNSLTEDITEMDSLINELLTYAGFEQRDQVLDVKSGDLNALVENLLASNNGGSDEFHVKCCVKNLLGDASVVCEWYLFERCIHNVIQNAFKYANALIMITLNIEDNQYCVVVEDDGPGIPIEDREKVFQAFVRLRHAEREKRSGFGLGLAIVHRIMKWHKGSVIVESSSLGGAKFIMRWPVPTSAQSA